MIINRGFADPNGTRIGPNCFIMADSHIGHDSVIVGDCVIGNGVSVAGSVFVDRGAILSSAVVLHEKSRVGKFALLKGGTRVSANVPPFVIMAHNPVSYYGVNSVVMGKHGGFSDEQIDDVAKAYRHLYQTSTSIFNALQRIEADIAPSEIRDEIVNFVRYYGKPLAGHRVDLDD